MDRDFTTDYFIGNYICSLTIVYTYRLVSDNRLFSLFHLYQYSLLLIHLFSQIHGFGLVLRPIWFTQGHLCDQWIGAIHWSLVGSLLHHN